MNNQPEFCKWCETIKPTHFAFQCVKNPKRRKYKLRKNGKTSYAVKAAREVWFRENPPNDDGYYICYLGISELCPGQMLPIETTLDHVIPRSRAPHLRTELSNLKPACWFCNSKKGSRVL